MKKKVICFLLLAAVLCGINSYTIHKYPYERMEARIAIMSVVYNLPQMPVPKLWAHRCDSVEKMQENMSKFEGVELDINYFAEEHEFDVSHDKQEKLKYPLENFLSELSNSNTKIWLDFKNLSAENSLEAKQRLEFLFSKYHIDKSRAIVESHNVSELGHFRAAGWYTSYYVPSDEKRIF